MHIGKQIRRYRLQKSARQEELADFLGLSAQAVSKWETDASAPDIALLPRIAIFLGVTIDELFRIPDDEQFRRIENAFWAVRRIDEETFRYYARFLERKIEEDARDVRARVDLAALYNHRAYSDHRLADAYAREALALEPEHKPAWSALLEANAAPCGDEWLDNHFTLIEYCKDFLTRHPDNYRALYALIESLLRDDRFAEAEPFVERICRLPGRAYQGEIYLGDLCLGRGEAEAALAHWDKAVAIAPEVWQARCFRADRLKKLGRYAEALADYEQSFVMQAPPRLLDGLYSRAQLFEQMGRYAEALAERRRVVECLKADWQAEEGESLEAQMREIARLEALARGARG